MKNIVRSLVYLTTVFVFELMQVFVLYATDRYERVVRELPMGLRLNIFGDVGNRFIFLLLLLALNGRFFILINKSW
jgi:hypothetical protein